MNTSALHRAKELSAAQNRAIGMIANGARLPDVLDELCRAIDALIPGVVSTVLLMDPDGTRLWPGAGPRFPEALKPAINPWMVGPNRGACGTAAFHKVRVVISDVTTDARWPDEYRELAVYHGLRASWSQPLVTNAGTVLGTFAMYYPEPRVPEEADLDLIEAAGQVALIAIQLDQSQSALSMVSRRLIDAQEKERTRLARELHDDINQRLTLVALSLDRLKHDSIGAGRLHEEITAVNAKVVDLVQDIQALSHRLHSSKLDLLGLPRAAADLCAELGDSHGVAIDFTFDNVADRLPPEIALCLFRVLQEALRNATKHSGARHILVALRRVACDLELTVVDEGAGFDTQAARRGLGLTSMTERMKLVEGELLIESRPGAGTTVRARIPSARGL